MAPRWILSLGAACVAFLGAALLYGQTSGTRDPAPRIGATITRTPSATNGSSAPRDERYPADSRTTPTTGAGSSATNGSSTTGLPGLEPLRRSDRSRGRDAADDRRDDPPSTRPSSSTRPADRPAERPTAPIDVRVTTGDGTIPNRHGQVWREYDISPYTQAVTATRRPEQSIIDWILHDTGYEVWHGEEVAMLSADLKTLRVYHTPDVQRTVSEIVERFVTRPVDSHAIGLRVMTVGSPDWRSRAARMMNPIVAETPGVQAWLMRPEDAALVLGDLAKRTDFREHTAPQLAGANGQPLDVVATRPRNYVQGITFAAGTGAAAQTLGSVNEGLSLSLLPLLSRDGKDIDAIIRCTVDQVEKLQPVTMESAGVGARARTQIEVPQVAEYRLHERFRWPSNQVLLVSAGLVASPTPAAARPIPLPLAQPPRVELLIAVDARAQAAPTSGTGAATRPAAGAYHGRY